jgi:hypothetical protein
MRGKPVTGLIFAMKEGSILEGKPWAWISGHPAMGGGIISF